MSAAEQMAPEARPRIDHERLLRALRAVQQRTGHPVEGEQLRRRLGLRCEDWRQALGHELRQLEGQGLVRRVSDQRLPVVRVVGQRRVDQGTRKVPGGWVVVGEPLATCFERRISEAKS